MVCGCNLPHVLIFNDSLTSGKAFHMARKGDVAGSVECLRYYAGWADKISGNVIEVGPVIVTTIADSV